MKNKKICKTCGKVIKLKKYSLSPKNWRNRQYCDNKCRYFRKNRIYKKKCKQCGKVIFKKDYVQLSYKNWRKKKFCNNICSGAFKKGKIFEDIIKDKKKVKKMLLLCQGKNNNFYNNGIKFYYNTNRTKKIIFRRDKGICQLCFKKVFINEKDERKIWNCHHIHYNSKDKDLKTIVLLHHSCHTKTRFNRDYWFAYFCYQKSIEPGDIIA